MDDFPAGIESAGFLNENKVITEKHNVSKPNTTYRNSMQVEKERAFSTWTVQKNRHETRPSPSELIQVAVHVEMFLRRYQKMIWAIFQLDSRETKNNLFPNRHFGEQAASTRQRYTSAWQIWCS